MVSNRDVASRLRFFGQMLEINGEDRFKVNAYYRAAEAVFRQPGPVTSMAEEELVEIPGIGRQIAGKIKEYSETGTIHELDELIEIMPPALASLLDLDGVGPKSVRKLWLKLDIDSIEDLEKAAKGHRIRALKGFGPKKEEEILHAIESLKSRQGRMNRLEAEKLIGRLSEVIDERRFVIAGSYRRGKATIGDIDVVTTQTPHQVISRLRETATEIIDEGERRTSIRIDGRRVDIRFAVHPYFGSMLLYLTGSKEFNIQMRSIANDRGYKLNEYGLERKTDQVLETFPAEEALFSALGMEYIPPELRENRGEVEAALARRIPELVTNSDIKGDLHVHSNWSDGTLSLADIGRAGTSLGYEYVLVTDHSASLGIARGLDADNLQQQRKAIDDLNRTTDCRLLQGIEVDILTDGSLGLSDRALSVCDMVIASVHSGLKQDQNTMTRRIITAMQNEHVDIIGHPTGRLIGKREPAEIDMERVLDSAHDTGTALEINASPWRLDLEDTYVIQAVRKGVKLSMGTDAHHASELAHMQYGLLMARRGWCRPTDLLNTMSCTELLEWVSG